MMAFFPFIAGIWHLQGIILLPEHGGDDCRLNFRVMLDIDHKLVQQIAKMPTRHSWAVPIMLLPEEQADREEARILDWIDEKVPELYPESVQAARLVRTMWLHLLERRAMAMWADKYPYKARYVPVVFGAMDAVEYAAMDVMYVSAQDKEIAREFLERMDSGELKPEIGR